MSTPAIETKIELLTESIESLIVACVTAQTYTDTRPVDPAVRFEAVRIARQECKDALRHFLAPVLRAVP